MIIYDAVKRVCLFSRSTQETFFMIYFSDRVTSLELRFN